MSFPDGTVPAVCLGRQKEAGLDSSTNSLCCKWMPYCYCIYTLCSKADYDSVEGNKEACFAEQDNSHYCADNSTLCVKMHDPDVRFKVYAQKCPQVGHLDVLVRGENGRSALSPGPINTRSLLVMTIFVVAVLLFAGGLFLWVGNIFLGGRGRWAHKRSNGTNKTRVKGLKHNSKYKKVSSSNGGGGGAHGDKIKHAKSSSKPKSPGSHRKVAGKKAAADANRLGTKERLDGADQLSFNSRQTSTVRLNPNPNPTAGKGARVQLTYTKFRNACALK